MSKKKNVLLSQEVFNLLSLIYPNVPSYDTSVKSMIDQGTPVLPTEEQYYDSDTPIHIYKSFDFKSMTVDPSVLKSSMNYVEPSPVNSQPLTSPQNAVTQ